MWDNPCITEASSNGWAHGTLGRHRGRQRGTYGLTDLIASTGWWLSSGGNILLTVTKTSVLAECKELGTGNKILLMSSGIVSTWLLLMNSDQWILATNRWHCILWYYQARVSSLSLLLWPHCDEPVGWWLGDWGRGWLAPTECVILSTWWLSSSFAEVNFWWAFRSSPGCLPCGPSRHLFQTNLPLISQPCCFQIYIIQPSCWSEPMG